MTWESFDELQREMSQTIGECRKFLFITRGKEFQEEVINQLQSLLGKIRTAKTQAIEDQAEQWANLLLLYECITNAFFEFAKMWVEIKNDEMDRAWDSLVNAQMAVRAAILVRDDPQLHKFNERLHLIESVSKYSVNPSPALAFSRSGGYSRPLWTTDQPPFFVSLRCGFPFRNWAASPPVRPCLRLRLPYHRLLRFVRLRRFPKAPVRCARG